MAFEVSNTGYRQIDPTFLPGYPYEEKYHNIGQLQTPYQGKRMGKLGDYGPPQATRYYTPWNPTYPYVLDKDFQASEYLPGNGCCYGHPGYSPCYEAEYPSKYIPGDYFAPQVTLPKGHVQNPSHPESVSVRRENYGRDSSGDVTNRFRLATLGVPVASKMFYPFSE